MKNKKGSLVDLFLFLSITFVLAIFSVSMYFVANKTNQALHDNSPALQKALGNSGNATEIISSTFGQVSVAYSSLKWITFMLIIGYALSILITSFLVKTNPIFFVPYIFIVVIAVFISAPLSNSYETIYQNPILAESFSGFFGQNWIFLHLPTWIAVIGIFAGILMFINVARNQ